MYGKEYEIYLEQKSKIVIYFLIEMNTDLLGLENNDNLDKN